MSYHHKFLEVSWEDNSKPCPGAQFSANWPDQKVTRLSSQLTSSSFFSIASQPANSPLIFVHFGGFFFPSYFHAYVQNCLALINQTINRKSPLHFPSLPLLPIRWSPTCECLWDKQGTALAWARPCLGVVLSCPLTSTTLPWFTWEEVTHDHITDLIQSQHTTFTISFSPVRGCPKSCYMQTELVGLLLCQ